MTHVVDFVTVSTSGLETSPVAAALAGLRANEARYFKNKYDHVFTVEPAGSAKPVVDWVHRILEEERGIVISSPPLEATAFEVDNMRMAYVFYQSGLSVNVMYTLGSLMRASATIRAWIKRTASFLCRSSINQINDIRHLLSLLKLGEPLKQGTSRNNLSNNR